MIDEVDKCANNELFLSFLGILRDKYIRRADNEDATFKNVTISDNGITLVPFNLNNQDGYQPTFYNKEQIENLPVRIIGIAKEKRTRL